jgi:hypothetical protein
MKKIVMLLAMGMFVGTLSYSSYAAVNEVVVENVDGDDKKKKKKKKKKDACCSKDAKTAQTNGVEGKSCSSKAEGEKKSCCSKPAEKK